MSDEVVGLEGKSIIVHEDVMPEQVNGKLVYPRAYFEGDVKELVKIVRREEREMMITILEQLRDYTDYGLVDTIEFIKLLEHDFIEEIRQSLKNKGASKEDFINFLKKKKELQL